MASKKKASKKAAKKLVSRSISWDWRDQPELEDLQAALRPFGVTVTFHPACEGQDAIGYIFSNRKLTGLELRDAGEEC